MELIYDKIKEERDPAYNPHLQDDGTIKHYNHYYKDPKKLADATEAFDYWKLFKETGEKRYLELCFEKLDGWLVKFCLPSIRKGYSTIIEDAIQQARIDVWAALRNTKKSFPSPLHFFSYIKRTALFGVAYAKRFKFRNLGRNNWEDYEYERIFSTKTQHQLNHNLIRLEAMLQQRMKYIPKGMTMTQLRKIEELYGRYIYGFVEWFE